MSHGTFPGGDGGILKNVDGGFEPVEGDPVFESLKYLLIVEADRRNFHPGPHALASIIKLMKGKGVCAFRHMFFIPAAAAFYILLLFFQTYIRTSKT